MRGPPSRAVLVVAIWYALTTTTGICSPEIFAALIKPAPQGLGLSVSSAGLLLTVEMVANGALGLSARLFDRVSSRTLVACGFAAALLANLATVGATGLALLILLRGIAGAGLGAVVIAASRFVAASSEPDRLSSLLMVSSTILNGAVLIAFGNSSPSVATVFATLAALALLGLVLMGLGGGTATSPAAAEAAASRLASAVPALMPGLLLIGATALLNTSDAGLYALTSIVADQAGVDERMLGYILTAAMVAGVAAAIAAGWLRSATSRAYGLTGSILVKALVALALVRMTGVAGFGAMATLYSITYFYATPLLIGASAHLDARGRLAAQVSGAIQIGAAFGPAWAGGLEELSGTRAVAAVCATVLVVSAALCLSPLRAVRSVG